LDTETSSSNRPDLQDDRNLAASEAGKDQGKAPSSAVELILGGYSYGSMIVSHLPTVEDVLKLFSQPARSSPAKGISLKAEELSKTWNEGPPNRTQESQNGTDQVTMPKISYLLVSPILPPVSMFVTMFSRISFFSGTSSGLSLQGTHMSTPPPDEQLLRHSTFIVYGTNDKFTPRMKIRRWVDNLCSASGSNVDSREIDGAGHFWVERDTALQMRWALREWLCRKQ
jgi:hypothetical protein